MARRKIRRELSYAGLGSNDPNVKNMNSLKAEKGFRILQDEYDDLEWAMQRMYEAIVSHTDKNSDVDQACIDFHAHILNASKRYWVANGLSKRDYKNVIAYLDAMTAILKDPTSWERNDTLKPDVDFYNPRKIGQNTLYRTSNGKRVLGVALLLLGVCLLIATAAFCIATWGTMTPVAPLVGLGAKSMIATGIASLGLSTAASSTMVAGGTALGALSLFKAKHCFKAGATKDIAEAGDVFMNYLDSKRPPRDFTDFVGGSAMDFGPLS